MIDIILVLIQRLNKRNNIFIYVLICSELKTILPDKIFWVANIIFLIYSLILLDGIYIYIPSNPIDGQKFIYLSLD